MHRVLGLSLSILARSASIAQGRSIAAPAATAAFATSRTVMSASAYKRAKLDPSAPASAGTIGTHSGTFQADEALGVWMLRQTEAYRHARVVRSRDPATLGPLEIVIDVGGVYDHTALRYDHHQRGYEERFEEGRCTKLSASGLVYRHYGREVIKVSEEMILKLRGGGGRRGYRLMMDVCVFVCVCVCAAILCRNFHFIFPPPGRPIHIILTRACVVFKILPRQNYYPTLGDADLELAYTKMYDSFMEAIDAIDTGVEAVPEGTELIYRDRTGLSARVSRCNPRWNEIDEATGERPDENDRFEVASAMCGTDFLSVLSQVVESDLPARSYVERALLVRSATDPSGEIIRLESGGLPWRNHLYDLERVHGIPDDRLVKFVLYTDTAGMWRVQAVTVEGRGFENRLGLPEEWRGVRDEELAKISGIAGARFCHAAGFIGGNETFEGALEMAKEALRRR